MGWGGLLAALRAVGEASAPGCGSDTWDGEEAWVGRPCVFDEGQARVTRLFVHTPLAPGEGGGGGGGGGAAAQATEGMRSRTAAWGAGGLRGAVPTRSRHLALGLLAGGSLPAQPREVQPPGAQPSRAQICPERPSHRQRPGLRPARTGGRDRATSPERRCGCEATSTPGRRGTGGTCSGFSTPPSAPRTTTPSPQPCGTARRRCWPPSSPVPPRGRGVFRSVLRVPPTPGRGHPTDASQARSPRRPPCSPSRRQPSQRRHQPLPGRSWSRSAVMHVCASAAAAAQRHSSRLVLSFLPLPVQARWRCCRSPTPGLLARPRSPRATTWKACIARSPCLTISALCLGPSLVVVAL